jgi:hypothetical protein
MYLLDTFFPFKTIRVRNFEPPWMHVSLKIMINDRDRAFSNKEHAKFLRLRENVINHTKFLQSSYLRAAAMSGDPRKLWNAINSVTRRHKKSPAIQFSSDEFNLFFSSNFQNDHSSCSSSIELPSIDLCVTSYETESYLRTLKKTSQGPDGIPPWVFRECSFAFAPVVTSLLNRIFQDGLVPSCLKVADVCPIPKCSNPSQISDFRPISKLPILSKIFEKILCKKYLIPYVRHKVGQNQFAYIPGSGKGTVTALTCMSLHVLRHLDHSSGGVRIAAVDFSKAFDRVTHTSILDACHRFEVPRQIVHLIASYLHNRVQRVTVNGKSSDYVSIVSGVPQGSIIGPILFSLVIDSFTTVCDNSIVVKYADDLTILHFLRDESDDRLQDEVDNISSWSVTNNLSINHSKSFVMDIVTKKSLICKPVNLLGDPIRCVPSIRILGCIFSDDLKWNEFVNYVTCVASRRIHLILSLKRARCDDDILFSTYIALIRPILLYAYPAVCNMSSYLRNRLEKVERRVFRIFDCKRKFPSLLSVGDKMCDR